LAINLCYSLVLCIFFRVSGEYIGKLSKSGDHAVHEKSSSVSQAQPLKRAELSATGTVAVNPEVGFVWQSDMTYENDFCGEADTPASKKLKQVVPMENLGLPSQTSNYGQCRPTGQGFAKPKEQEDSESSRGSASFSHSHTAAVRLTAECLNAKQRKANLSLTSPAEKTRTTTPLIQNRTTAQLIQVQQLLLLAICVCSFSVRKV
jgi:hypothetical protein